MILSYVTENELPAQGELDRTSPENLSLEFVIFSIWSYCNFHVERFVIGHQQSAFSQGRKTDKQFKQILSFFFKLSAER